MLLKQSKGYAFYGALNYVLGKPGAQWIDGNAIDQDAASLDQAFEQIATVRSGVQRRLYHCSLSLPTGEQLDDRSWRHLARDYLSQMGFAGHQYIVVRHTDTPSHDHVHIVANRVGMGGTVVQDSFDHYRGQAVLRDLEMTYGLQPNPSSWERQRREQSQRQVKKSIATGTPTVQQQLQETIDDILPGCTSFDEFIDGLDAQAIGLRVHYGYDNQAIGLSYTKAGVTMNGSALGRGYSFEGIRRQLVVEVEPEISLHSPETVQTTRERIMSTIDQVRSEQPLLPELIEQLAAVGIETHVNYHKQRGGKRRATGIVYSQAGICFSGVALGPEYDLKGLAQSGICYQAGRDDDWIQQWQRYMRGQGERPVPASRLKSAPTVESVDGMVITQLQPHQVYVFGSSDDGQHETGMGLALYGPIAREQRCYAVVEENVGERAVWGQGRGYQTGRLGSSYAISTKRLWTHKKSMPMCEIQAQLKAFSQFAADHPEQEFIVGQFHDRVMRKLWAATPLPDNVQLPAGWSAPRLALTQMPTATMRRIIMTGDTASRFNSTTRDQAIQYLHAGVLITFEAAQTAGYQRLEFISSLRSGVEHWGTVAALQLRAQQQAGEIDSVPQIQVIAAKPKHALTPEQQRVFDAVDQVIDSRPAELMRQQHDQLLFVQIREANQATERLRMMAKQRRLESRGWSIGD